MTQPFASEWIAHNRSAWATVCKYAHLHASKGERFPISKLIAESYFESDPYIRHALDRVSPAQYHLIAEALPDQYQPFLLGGAWHITASFKPTQADGKGYWTLHAPISSHVTIEPPYESLATDIFADCNGWTVMLWDGFSCHLPRRPQLKRTMLCRDRDTAFAAGAHLLATAHKGAVDSVD